MTKLPCLRTLISSFNTSFALEKVNSVNLKWSLILLKHVSVNVLVCNELNFKNLLQHIKLSRSCDFNLGKEKMFINLSSCQANPCINQRRVSFTTFGKDVNLFKCDKFGDLLS